MQSGLVFALVCALLAIVYGIWQITRILRLPEGNPRMREIAAAIREGAIAYLWRQYKTIAMVGVILFLVIGLVPGLGWMTAWGSSRRCSRRLRHHRHEHLRARQRAHRRGGAHRPEPRRCRSPSTAAPSPACSWSGWVCSAWRATSRALCQRDRQDPAHAHPHPLVGLAFGASLISIFARLGGGMFTGGADVGADLVGKVEAGIPEDDPRTPR
jgi:K(+)-stimulated pyrophosphate-energized sodium pump